MPKNRPATRDIVMREVAVRAGRVISLNLNYGAVKKMRTLCISELESIGGGEEDGFQYIDDGSSCMAPDNSGNTLGDADALKLVNSIDLAMTDPAMAFAMLVTAITDHPPSEGVTTNPMGDGWGNGN